MADENQTQDDPSAILDSIINGEEQVGAQETAPEGTETAPEGAEDTPAPEEKPYLTHDNLTFKTKEDFDTYLRKKDDGYRKMAERAKAAEMRAQQKAQEKQLSADEIVSTVLGKIFSTTKQEADFATMTPEQRKLYEIERRTDPDSIRSVVEQAVQSALRPIQEERRRQEGEAIYQRNVNEAFDEIDLELGGDEALKALEEAAKGDEKLSARLEKFKSLCVQSSLATYKIDQETQQWRREVSAGQIFKELASGLIDAYNKHLQTTAKTTQDKTKRGSLGSAGKGKTPPPGSQANPLDKFPLDKMHREDFSSPEFLDALLGGK